MFVGTFVGLSVGNSVEGADGVSVGHVEGTNVGTPADLLGRCVGISLGLIDGEAVGSTVM